MLEKFVVIIVIILALVGISIGRNWVPNTETRTNAVVQIGRKISAPLAKFYKPRSILRPPGLRVAPKTVAFSEKVTLRTIDSKGRVRDKDRPLNKSARIDAREKYPRV